MEKPSPQPPVFGENIAGRMADVVRKLQKNREQHAGVRRPTPIAQKVSQGQEVMNALMEKKANEQEQDASRTTGALQEERGQEQGRQRDVGQREEEGRFGESSQVQGTEEERQQRGKIR